MIEQTITHISSTVGGIVDSAIDTLTDTISSTYSSLSSLASDAFDLLDFSKTAEEKKKEEDEAVKELEKKNKELNEALSSMGQPLIDAFKQFKQIPSKIKSALDIKGQATGFYDKLGELAKKTETLLDMVIDTKTVPITTEDYKANPTEYPKLQEVEKKKFKVEQEDCDASGYTKKETETSSEFKEKKEDVEQKPEEQDTVEQIMEDVFNSTLKPIWEQLKTPLNTIGMICQVPPIDKIADAMVSGIEAFGDIVTLSVPDKKLDEMLAKKQEATAKALEEATKAIESDTGINKSPKDVLNKSIDDSKKKKEQASKETNVVEGQFKNIEQPEMPEDAKSTLQELKECVQYVKDFITMIFSNVFMVIIDKIIECIKKIFDLIGLGKLPPPLNNITQIFTAMKELFDFVTGLPMSLMNVITSIYNKKLKMLQVCSSPIPVETLADFQSLPSTSEDAKDKTDEKDEKDTNDKKEENSIFDSLTNLVTGSVDSVKNIV